MYHNDDKTINKHVEAERRTSRSRTVQGAVPSANSACPSEVRKGEDVARIARSRATWSLKRDPIRTLKLAAAA
jgi:hypothetical protein